MASKVDNRSRNWTVVMYPDDLPEDWLDIFRNFKIPAVVSPLHDQDFDEKGDPKKPHYHTMLMFSSKKSEQQVREMFENAYGIRIDPKTKKRSIAGVGNISDKNRVREKTAMIRYFCHVDDPSKAQYNTADIIGVNGADVTALLKRSMQEIQDTMQEIQQYIIDNDITEFCDILDIAMVTDREWYRLLTTVCTNVFCKYLDSRRNSKPTEQSNQVMQEMQKIYAELERLEQERRENRSEAL